MDAIKGGVIFILVTAGTVLIIEQGDIPSRLCLQWAVGEFADISVALDTGIPLVTMG